MKKKYLLIMMLLLASCGEASSPQNASNGPETSTSVEFFQIFKKGENTPLQKLEVSNGDVIDLEARGNITENLTWFNAASDVAVFLAPGRLRINGEARFLVGAYNSKTSYYFIVETEAVRHSLSPTVSIPRQETPSPSCIPTTCEIEEKNCGSIPDGCGYFISCGSCSGSDTCGGEGVMNVCGTANPVCVPQSCESLGRNCGSVSNGCGSNLNCGSCEVEGESCGGSGISNLCGAPPGLEQPPSVASDPYVDQVVSFEPGNGAGFGQASMPGVILGHPRGNGLAMGGLDVLSLGQGGRIVLRTVTPILNGPGADFIVFENAFYAGGNPMNAFAEPGQVAVSQDGVSFHDFPCDSANAAGHFPGCAGTRPTLANPITNMISPTDPAVAGGNAFDLSDLDLGWALYIEITDRSAGVGGGGTAGFDLDAVSIVYQ